MLILKGVHIEELMASSVFTHTFHFHTWPQVHTNDVQVLRPFNGCFFDLRYSYKTIFPEEQFEPIENQKLDKTKIQKIEYSVNLLCKIGQFINKDGKMENSEISLMELLSETEEICMFDT